MHLGLSHLVPWDYTELHQLSSSPTTHVHELQDLLWLFLNLFNCNIKVWVEGQKWGSRAPRLTLRFESWVILFKPIMLFWCKSIRYGQSNVTGVFVGVTVGTLLISLMSGLVSCKRLWYPLVTGRKHPWSFILVNIWDRFQCFEKIKGFEWGHTLCSWPFLQPF